MTYVRCISRADGTEELVSLDFAATRVARYYEWPVEEARAALLRREAWATISFVYRFAEEFPAARAEPAP